MNQELALYELKKSYMQLYSIELVFFMASTEGNDDPWIKGKDRVSGDILMDIYPDGSWGYSTTALDNDRVYKKTGFDPALIRRITHENQS